APNILPASNRPLDFVEIPITSDSPMDVRAGTSLYVLGQYLKLIFTSYPMRYYYGYAQIVPVSMGNPLALLSLALHAFFLVLSFIFLNKNTLISFGLVFYLISIAIFSHFSHPVVGIMDDRFTYVPSLGFCI